jgi:2-polyprenyl-3-methyl-5-hydroxy-6-metoxy-1,4-benzoquinol methylase
LAVLYADAQFKFDRVKRKQAALSLSVIKKFMKTGSLLELGAGGGSFLQEARDWGYEPHAIELNPIEAKWIEEELAIPCENKVLSDNSFGGKQFDIIYHNDVLSHFYDPIEAFLCMNRALRKGGYLVFETGNIADVRQNFYNLFSQLSYPDHLFFFGEKSIHLLLDRTGFEQVYINRKSTILCLLLQKALWEFKDSLKDESVREEMKTHKGLALQSSGSSFKRRLRLMYRYLGHSLFRLGGILPKNGRPLKLLIVARKSSNARSC